METNITTVEQTEILKEEEKNNILETAFSKSNDPLYLQSFLSVNSLLLKKSFSDDYEQLALEYSYRSIRDQITFIDRVVDEFFFVEKIEIKRLLKIKTSIVRIFKDHMELFFSQMKTEILSLKFQARNTEEFLRIKFSHVWKSINGYRKYLKTTGEDNKRIIYLAYKYIPYDTRLKIDGHVFVKGFTLKLWIRMYEHVERNPGLLEKLHNEKFRDVVTMHTEEILDMNDKHLSLAKIQKQLTKHCINEGKISSTMQRMNRKKGSKNELITVPTLLPLSKIKEIIENRENREKPCLIAN
jgi:hypothetical protein